MIRMKKRIVENDVPRIITSNLIMYAGTHFKLSCQECTNSISIDRYRIMIVECFT